MKKVQFTATHSCAPDGKTVRKFKKGDVEELPDKIADSCVRGKVAELVDGSDAPEPKSESQKTDDKEPQKDAQSSEAGQDGSEGSESSEDAQSGSQDQETSEKDSSTEDESSEGATRTPRRPVEEQSS